MPKSTYHFEYFLFSFRAVPKSADRVRPDRGRAVHASTEHRDPPSHWGHAASAPTSSRCRPCKSSIIDLVSLKKNCSDRPADSRARARPSCKLQRRPGRGRGQVGHPPAARVLARRAKPLLQKGSRVCSPRRRQTLSSACPDRKFLFIY